ncbi:MFS transporter [Bacillus sp. RD4P76]|uniref:MFS transporter n=2 Tax=Bacillus suaedaesalsae TaxID=2810349 RepID=A0ABS2DGR1_9BACI|nr:MFS transporter [Bacillus suaedaesalsae]
MFLSLPVISWALYDFANTIFSSNITTIFFPFYLQEVIGKDEVLNQVASTFITYSNAIASFFLVIFSPLFGVLIDRTNQKKRYLVPFALISITATILMGVFATFISDATVGLILVLLSFVIAKFFYNSSLVFYDPMISDIGNDREVPLLSGYGVAIGYLGTLIGLTVYPLVGDGGFHEAFIPTGILFLLFSLPIFFFYKDQPRKQVVEKKSFLSGYGEILETFKDMRSQYKGIFLFMIAYFFFNDAIATAISVMAIYAKAIVGFSTGMFILLYLVSTISSIIGSFIFGYITRNVGAKKAVTMVAIILLIALVIATIATNQGLFWIAGSLYGVAMGAMWVTSRTMIVELTPKEKRGQFFGLFAFSGKVSSIVGPLIYGTITLVLKDYGNLASRLALGSLIILVLCGIYFHLRVPYKKA